MIEKIDFSFRDYVAFMFPGMLIIGAICIQIPNSFDWLEQHKFIATAIFLVGGYIAGRLSNSISYGTILKLSFKVFGSPTKILSEKGSHFLTKIDEAFKEELVTVLRRHWGANLVENGNEANLLFLCNRKIEENDHRTLDTQGRRVSIHEFHAALMPAMFVFSISLMLDEKIFTGLLVLPLIYFSLKSFYGFRRQFVVNIYRLFYIQNRDGVRE